MKMLIGLLVILSFSSWNRVNAQSLPTVAYYVPWTKICKSRQDNKPVCFTGSSGLSKDSQYVMSFALMELPGSKKLLRLIVHFKPQTSFGYNLYLDNKSVVLHNPFQLCNADQCISDLDISPAIFSQLQKGGRLIIDCNTISDNWVRFTISLSGFAEAEAGAAIDSKTFATLAENARQDYLVTLNPYYNYYATHPDKPASSDDSDNTEKKPIPKTCSGMCEYNFRECIKEADEAKKRMSPRPFDEMYPNSSNFLPEDLRDAQREWSEDEKNATNLGNKIYEETCRPTHDKCTNECK